MKSTRDRPVRPKPRFRAGQIDGVAIHCRFDDIRHACDLKLYPGNYRKHPAKQLERMHRVIVGDGSKPGNGWRRAIVVSSLSGCVIKGNGTVQMAQRYKLAVPVEIQTYASRAEELRDLIADNRLPELAQDDEGALRKLLDEIDADDVALTGVSDQELKALIEREEEAGKLDEAHELFEHYDYVVLFFKNDLDLLAAHEHFQVKDVRKPRRKVNNIGKGRVIDGAAYLSRIRKLLEKKK